MEKPNNLSENGPKEITHKESVQARLEAIKARQAEIAPFVGSVTNKNLTEENDELIKEALSLSAELNKIEPLEENAPKKSRFEKPKKKVVQEKTPQVITVELRMSDAEEEIKTVKNTIKNTKFIDQQDKIDLENELKLLEDRKEVIKSEIAKSNNQNNEPELRFQLTKIMSEVCDIEDKCEKFSTPPKKIESEEVSDKKISPEGKKGSLQEMTLERRLEKSRENYIKEYKRCKSEADRQYLISKTKNAILNIFKSKENRKKVRPEDFFTDKLKETKNKYDQFRIEVGNKMYDQKKAELKKAGLSGKELEKALINYKATEILSKTIIEERQKLINMKAEGAPIKLALWKKLLDGYMKIKPRWKRVALSTLIFLPLAASSGALSASIIAGYGIAGLAAVKFGTSMAIGAGVGQVFKEIDWMKKGSDARFKEDQDESKEELKYRFSKGEIGLEDYEKKIGKLEAEEKKRSRNRMLVKAGVGFALAGTAGFIVYDALGNGISHSTNVDAVSGATVNHTPTIPVIHHESIEVTAVHGKGAILSIKELQNDLKVEYPDLSKAPESVKHILNTDAHKLAQEYNMYKPGESAESALVKTGSVFKVDESGNLTYQEAGTTNTITLEKGIDLKGNGAYEGKMFDSDHSGLKAENQMAEQISPEPIDSTTGASLPEIQEVPHNVDPTNGSLVENTESVKNFAFENSNHTISITDNGSDLKLQFQYDPSGKITGVEAGGHYYGTEANPYANETKIHEILDGYKQVDANRDIFKMTYEARFLDRIPQNTLEYQYLHEHVANMQKDIIKEYGDILNHEKLITNIPTINTKEVIEGTQIQGEVLPQINQINEQNIDHIFPKGLRPWEEIKNSATAEKFMDSGVDGVKDEYKPLISYLGKLKEISNIKPIGATLINRGETIPEYMNRALQQIQEAGRLDEVKL